MVTEKVENGKVDATAFKALENLGGVEDTPLSKVLANAGRGAAEPLKKAEEVDYRPASAKKGPGVVEIIQAQADGCRNVQDNAQASIKKKLEEIELKTGEIMKLMGEVRNLRRDIHNLELVTNAAALQQEMLEAGVVL